MSGREFGQQPAFPIVSTDEKDSEIWQDHSIGNVSSRGGMTLRQHIAVELAKAVITTGVDGTVKDAARRIGIPPEDYKYEIHWPKVCAIEAIEMADALLEQLAKEPT